MAEKHKDLSRVAEEALRETDEHAAKSADPVPPAENGSHAHSHAAHLGTDAQPDTRGKDTLHEGRQPGALREPPMVQERSGKGKR